MKKFDFCIAVIGICLCLILSGCGTITQGSDATDTKYEEQFLGKWSNDEALFSFQYKDGVYCGGALSSELSTVVFTKYTATKTTLTIYIEDGRVETFSYKFDNDCLYLDDMKLEKFN